MTASRTRAVVQLADGRARFTELSAGGHLRPRPMSVDGRHARLALVSTYAMLLDGDDVQVEIEVGAGVCLELVEPSGTVAYDMRGGSAEYAMHLSVAAGAQLTWRGSPFVVSAGADLVRRTRIDVAAGGRALISELMMLGRSYESGGGPLRVTVHAHHDGLPVLVEDLDLRETLLRERPGVLGANRAVGSVLLLGDRPEQTHGRHETRLAGPGAFARALATDAHLAEEALTPTWRRWSDRLAEQDQAAEEVRPAPVGHPGR